MGAHTVEYKLIRAAHAKCVHRLARQKVSRCATSALQQRTQVRRTKVDKSSIAEHKVRVVFAKLALALLAGCWHVNINLTTSFCVSSKHLENFSTNSEWLYCESAWCFLRRYLIIPQCSVQFCIALSIQDNVMVKVLTEISPSIHKPLSFIVSLQFCAGLSAPFAATEEPLC